MDETVSEVVLTTRRRLHGIAECLMAGPEHAQTGEIALRVVPGGFATTTDPSIILDRTTLLAGQRRVQARGTFAELAAALGVEFGAPALGYSDGSGVAATDRVDLDPAATRLLLDWFALSDAALRRLAPDQPPVLWPEHFDVAVLLDDHSYGSSPGDSHHQAPYAYVSAPENDGSAFFNVPFGALLPASRATSVEALVAFWQEGRDRLRGR